MWRYQRKTNRIIVIDIRMKNTMHLTYMFATLWYAPGNVSAVQWLMLLMCVTHANAPSMLCDMVQNNKTHSHWRLCMCFFAIAAAFFLSNCSLFHSFIHFAFIFAFFFWIHCFFFRCIAVACSFVADNFSFLLHFLQCMHVFFLCFTFCHLDASMQTHDHH